MRRAVLGSTKKCWPSALDGVRPWSREQRRDLRPREGHQVMRTWITPWESEASSSKQYCERSTTRPGLCASVSVTRHWIVLCGGEVRHGEQCAVREERAGALAGVPRVPGGDARRRGGPRGRGSWTWWPGPPGGRDGAGPGAAPAAPRCARTARRGGAARVRRRGCGASDVAWHGPRRAWRTGALASRRPGARGCTGPPSGAGAPRRGSCGRTGAFASELGRRRARPRADGVGAPPVAVARSPPSRRRRRAAARAGRRAWSPPQARRRPAAPWRGWSSDPPPSSGDIAPSTASPPRDRGDPTEARSRRPQVGWSRRAREGPVQPM